MNMNKIKYSDPDGLKARAFAVVMSKAGVKV